MGVSRDLENVKMQEPKGHQATFFFFVLWLLEEVVVNIKGLVMFCVQMDVIFGGCSRGLWGLREQSVNTFNKISLSWKHLEGC